MVDLSQLIDPLAQRPDRGSEQPIDRAHLKKMTMDDDGLAREVLGLFDKQAGGLVTEMQLADPVAVAGLAHRLKGSACGIGAFAVARAAEAVELATDGERASALGRLAAAIGEARASIRELLRAN